MRQWLLLGRWVLAERRWPPWVRNSLTFGVLRQVYLLEKTSSGLRHLRQSVKVLWVALGGTGWRRSWTGRRARCWVVLVQWSHMVFSGLAFTL